MLTASPMEDMEEDMEEDTEDVMALRGLAPLRKPEPNMPEVLGVSGSLASCRNRDSRRLREEGLRPGGALPTGPWPKASTVRLLLSPVGTLDAPEPTCWNAAGHPPPEVWGGDGEGRR